MTSLHVPSPDEPSRGHAYRGTLNTASSIVAGQLAIGIAFVVLAREVSPPSYGLFSSFYALGIVLGGILDFGSSQRIARELSRGNGLGTFRSWLFHRAALQLPLVLLASAVVFHFFGGQRASIVVLALTFQGLTYPFALGATAATRALRSPALATWLIALGNVLFLGIVVASPNEYLVEAAALGALTSWCLTAFLALATVHSALGRSRTSWKANPWHGSGDFGIFALAIAAHGLTIAVVGATAGAFEAGQLAAVWRWVQPVYLLAGAFAFQAYPGLAAARSDAAALRILRPIWVIAALGAVSAVAIVFWAPALVGLLLGSAYADSVILLQASAVAAVPVLFTLPLATFLQARGSERAVALWTGSLGVVALAGTAILSPLFGAIAAPVLVGLWNVALCAMLVRETLRTTL